MAKVYVITRGDYSDYHICAVTMDDVKAKTLAKMYSTRYDAANVETWETDTEANVNALNGRRQYYVNFNSDGSADVLRNNWDYEDFREGIIEDEYRYFSVRLYAKDEDSAIKIAAEKRAKYLAEKEGIV